MYTYDNTHLTPSSVSPVVPKVRVSGTINEPKHLTDSEKVAWAAKILRDYTHEMKAQNERTTHLEHDEYENESVKEPEETDKTEGDSFYQMCYMPIVLACILIGALMIGVVIYFVEDNPAVTTDNPVNE